MGRAGSGLAEGVPTPQWCRYEASKLMKSAIPTPDEDKRVKALKSLNIVFSPAEERFDRITALASKLFDVPIALISLVSDDIQWFKASCGLDADQTGRDVSFCGHAIHQEDAFVVEDALLHPHFADNPLVTGPPHVRFYAGQPLAYQGYMVGTLCLIDHIPRKLETSDLETLRQLGSWVENELNAQQPKTADRVVFNELTESEREKLQDPQTRMLNRAGLQRVMERVLADSRSESLMAVLKCAEDRGDLPLDIAATSNRETARRIRSLTGIDDIVAHLGGGEFFLFSPDIDSATADLLLRRLSARLNETVMINAQALELNYCIGAVKGRVPAGALLDQVQERCTSALEATEAAAPSRLKVLEWPSVAP